MYLLMLTLPRIVWVFCDLLWITSRKIFILAHTILLEIDLMSKTTTKKPWIIPTLQEETVSTINSGGSTGNAETTSLHT